jgi:inhibitor of cysteine peptidase
MARITEVTTVQLVAVVAIAAAGIGVGAAVVAETPATDGSTTAAAQADSVSTFESAEAFRSYLERAERYDRGRPGVRRPAVVARGAGDGAAEEPDAATMEEPQAETTPQPTPAPTATPQAATEVEATAAGADDAVQDAAAGSGGSAGDARRASDTNVQVEGIDEPDILKATPQTLYYSPPTPRVRHAHDGPDERAGEGVRLINASDPAAPEIASRLDVSGQLLLSGETLVVFEDDRLVGYDISDRENPEQSWSKRLSDRVVTARLHAGTVYLVTTDGIDRREPCPIEPVDGVSVPCTEVHRPDRPAPADATYTVTLVDATDGSVGDSASFVGSGGSSAVYVSADSVYVTYPQQFDRTELMTRFFLENQSDRLDEETLDRIREIDDYEIGPRAKRIELRRAIESWLAGLDDQQRRETERKLDAARQKWVEAHKREFVRTGIVAFEVDGTDGGEPTVEAGATGSVPGVPLDQFSLNEHDGEFRIATTVPRLMGSESENDLYVLDESLSVTGSAKGMGITERIYSVRYAGDEAYVVTFRRIDPFHVVDLSDPENPTVEGELKLPGFSSYLHPLSEDRVLGIGEEDGKVKLVVFDVSDPEEPTIETDRILDAGWSAVNQNHRAFLMDRRHGVFFLPAGEEAYVFDYTDGLAVETVVRTDSRVHRTAYVGDNLYVFGDSSVTVVDETEWEETAELELGP